MKEYINMEKGSVFMQWVSQGKGAWKWCSNRGYYRVILSPYTKPAKVNCVRPGEKVLYKSGDCCGDYPGGYWGYENEEKEAKEAFLEGIEKIRNS